MPELPEVETTTRGLRKTIVGLTIAAVWTDLNTTDKRKRDTIADPKYFPLFKKEIVGEKVLSVERRGKNILISLSRGKTILIHMKMTGHLLYGNYKKDAVSRFIHFTATFSNGEKLYFSDMRKFGKITLLDTQTRNESKHLKDLGPEPLLASFTLKTLQERLNKKPQGKIMTVLMDQSVLAGIGNIYSDEVLWWVGIHPERKVSNVTQSEMAVTFKAIKEILVKGIDFGGDSMSDYRNIHGLSGKFQLHHNAYKRTGENCRKKGCIGKIIRKIINGRSGHYCNIHQK